MLIEQIEYHPVASIFPMMNSQEFMDLKADIADNGLREPIWMYQGKIIDGRNRYRACVDLGIEPDFREWPGDGDIVKFVLSLNLIRRHLNESQRAMIAARVANLQIGKPVANSVNSQNNVSQERAADMLQVSPWTVNKAKRVFEQAVPDLIHAVEEGRVAVSAAAHVATLPAEWQRVIVDNDQVSDAAREIRQGKQEAIEERVKPHVSFNSGNNEWYTPAEYIEAARAVMGSIDLDPASSEIANRTVKATVFYSAESDGLSKCWDGHVWMNPPYASELIGRFADKFTGHFTDGDIAEGIVLVNNATETGWFQTMLRCASAVCFIRRRVKFVDLNGNPSGAPLQGQAILYFGSRQDVFSRNYSQFGIVFYGATGCD